MGTPERLQLLKERHRAWLATRAGKDVLPFHTRDREQEGRQDPSGIKHVTRHGKRVIDPDWAVTVGLGGWTTNAEESPSEGYHRPRRRFTPSIHCCVGDAQGGHASDCRRAML